MVRGLVSSGLLFPTRAGQRSGAEPAWTGRQRRSRRTGCGQACAARRLVPLHGPILHTLHGRFAGQGRAFHGEQPSRIPLRPFEIGHSKPSGSVRNKIFPGDCHQRSGGAVAAAQRVHPCPTADWWDRCLAATQLSPDQTKSTRVQSSTALTCSPRYGGAAVPPINCRSLMAARLSVRSKVDELKS